jgi:hypothetical protein
MVVKVSKPEINVREKISELDKPTGIAGQAMLAAETPQEQQALVGVGRRNLIINGGMQVAQRGTSFTNVSGYTLDRWNCSNHGASGSVTQQSFSIGGSDNIEGRPKNFLRLTQSAASTSYYPNIQQPIELCRELSNQTLTLSFWAKADKQLDVRLYIYQPRSSGANIIPSPIIGTATTEWQKIIYTFTIPSASGITFTGTERTLLYIQTPTNDTHSFDITQVQLELGKVATPFEHRSYGEELALCQRYFEMIEFENSIDQNGSVAVEMLIGNGYAYTGGRTLNHLKFNVQKRTPPVVTINTASYYQVLDSNAGWVPANLVNARANVHGARIDAYVSGNVLTPGRALEVRLLPNGKISIDAEL